MGFTTNPRLYDNKVFRDQAEKLLKFTIYQSTMKVINIFLRKKDGCVIALEMVYEKKNTTKMYRVLNVSFILS